MSQRYNIECDDVGPLGVAKDDDGEYVRYDDVAAKLAAAERLAEAAGIAVAAWEHPSVTDHDVNTLMWDLKQALTAYTQTKETDDE